ncbi:flagellar biosynthetic protein FliR [methanotrophic endosymbiont of Bathymodiolus puteoserpentis (Logatchev)]|uniref:flagellar biosynthetic protein FliR n=1 Tax=methanotrophic endosymbiont of Bathymodiolus puteoserpentis (Logatchev) TaxID=343235 RepID=UPI0013C7CE30|nr:flagellar biosynthetic protein FliR [methanotrophic endosymbiont of Bathymodiolus puteoserpentis (Logatchev)]SHE19609.1 Flagellar biosynthesis protein FliR [methanotrophic endosymbiont of Bathymodiolus puteoserpentis (Logatchev)]
MHFTEQELLAKIALFVWPFIRISSLFMAIPIFSARTTPVKFRLLISFLITWVVIPFIPPLPDVPLMSYAGVMVTIQQMAIGLASAFILQMVFAVLLVGGQSIAYSMGLGFASMVDPASGVQVPVVAQILVITGSLFFMSVNGHLLLIELLIESFKTLPIDVIGLTKADLWAIIIWSGQMFAGGVLLALPIMSVVLFVNVSFGVASKAAPQLQIFGVGFPITIMVGLVLIWILMPNVIEAFSIVLADGFQLIKQVLRV